MRKTIALFLALVVTITFASCAKENAMPQSSAEFYFRTSETSFREKNGVIASEKRVIHTSDIQSILTQYLNGPKSEKLISPFPENLKLEDCITGPTRTTIVLSESITELSNQDLTIACACLAKTVFELTGTKSVEIKSGDGLIGGMQSIVLIQKDLLLRDDYFSSESVS